MFTSCFSLICEFPKYDEEPASPEYPELCKALKKDKEIITSFSLENHFVKLYLTVQF